MSDIKEEIKNIKDAIEDPAFKRAVIQGVVKAIAVTAAIGVTAAIVKHTDSGLVKLVENIQEAMSKNPVENELLQELHG